MTYTPIPRGTLDWDVPVNAAFVDQDTRITTNTADNVTQAGQIATNTADIAAQQALTNTSGWLPIEFGVKFWTFDPNTNTGASALVAGQLYIAKIVLRVATTITNIVYNVSTAGSGLTAGQNFIGLYTTTGTQLAATADQTTNWASIGTKTTPLTVPQSLSAGQYLVVFLANGTTPPQIMNGQGTSASLVNLGSPSPSLRYSTQAGPFTALPASFTHSTSVSTATVRWIGVN